MQYQTDPVQAFLTYLHEAQRHLDGLMASARYQMPGGPPVPPVAPAPQPSYYAAPQPAPTSERAPSQAAPLTVDPFRQSLWPDSTSTPARPAIAANTSSRSRRRARAEQQVSASSLNTGLDGAGDLERLPPKGGGAIARYVAAASTPASRRARLANAELDPEE